MATADRPGSGTGGVEAGFFSFTQITDASAHRAYNAWHQLDHLPEQMPIAGIAHGERWVVSPRCLAARDFVSADLAVAHYLTCYLMRPPLGETIACFYALAMRLHDEDRFFPHRRAIATAALAVQSAHAAPRVRVSAAAIPYRPNRGVYAVVERRQGRPLAEDDAAVPVRKIDDLLRIPGVAGFWTFGQTVSLEDGGVQPADQPEGGPATPETPGSEQSIDASVTLCYLDEDPVAVSAEISNLLRPDWERDGRVPDMAGPLEAITPWSWDWFDEDQTRPEQQVRPEEQTRPKTEGDC